MHMEAAGEAVLVTFDGIGRTSRSFSPVVNGQLVRFTSVGAGKMKDGVTGSIWNAETGECETGEFKGKLLLPREGGLRVVRSPRGKITDKRMAS